MHLIAAAVSVLVVVLVESRIHGQSIEPAARAELAPSGTLRAGINFSNTLLTGKDPKTGAAQGVAVDLARELARRLGMPLEIVPFEGAGAMAEAAKTKSWDVAFLAVDPARSEDILFTAPYAEIESTYLVPPGSSLTRIADVDRDGVRIAIAGKSAYDLFLTRALTRATLVRAPGLETAYEQFVREKLDALAGLRPNLTDLARGLPGSRVLDGRFTAVQQAVGTPAGRERAAAFLREFVNHAVSSGFVARTIESNKVTGLSLPQSGSQ